MHRTFFGWLWWSGKCFMATRISGCVRVDTHYLSLWKRVLFLTPPPGEPLSGASPLQPLWNGSISRGMGGVTRPGLELRLGITSPFIDSTLNAKCVQFESFYSITLTLGPASLPLNHEWCGASTIFWRNRPVFQGKKSSSLSGDFGWGENVYIPRCF